MGRKTANPQPVEVTHPDKAKGELEALGGSKYDAFNNAIANQAINALWMPGTTNDQTRDKLKTVVVAGLTGIRPQNEAEGMLGAQMVATHLAAMECFRRAMIEGQTLEGREHNLRFADRLSKTYAQQLDALKRFRRKADQTVRVERVIVKDGGQAIVGNVVKGGGDEPKNVGQPDAPSVTYEPGTEVRCEDTLREPVPVARSAR